MKPNQPWPRAGRSWYAVFLAGMTVLTLFANNGIVSLLLQSIKRDLQLSDTQVSLIVGFAAAAFNAIVSLPVSRLVDVVSRKLILGTGLLVVGAMSALSGLAGNFWQLFATRVGAGIGGSGNAAATYSMLADYFPPAKLPRAIAVMNIGFSSGAALALLLGGTLIAATSAMTNVELPLVGIVRPWQYAFLVMAIPDIVLGLMMLTTLMEPARRGRASAAALATYDAPATAAATAVPEVAAAPADAKPVAVGTSLPIRTVVRYLLDNRAAFGPLFLGLALNSLAMGALVWHAPFYERTYDWGPARYGIVQGFIYLLLWPPGLLFGGWLAEYFAKQGRDDANLRVVALAMAAHIPFAISYALMPSANLALTVGAINAVILSVSTGPLNAALQVIVPNNMRGQITALFIFLFTMIGTGIAPTVVAMITDYVFADESKLRYSIALLHLVTAPAAAWVFWRGVKPYGLAFNRAKAWHT
jgi:MFS family permease